MIALDCYLNVQENNCYTETETPFSAFPPFIQRHDPFGSLQLHNLKKKKEKPAVAGKQSARGGSLNAVVFHSKAKRKCPKFCGIMNDNYPLGTENVFVGTRITVSI